MNKNQPVTIAIYRLRAIGDVVLATSCLQLLREVAPQIRCIWLGADPAIDLIETLYPDVECIRLHNDTSLGSEELDRLRSIQCIIDLQCNPKSYMFTRKLRRFTQAPLFRTNKMRAFRNLLVLKARLRSRRQSLPHEALQPNFLQYELMQQTVIHALKAIGQYAGGDKEATFLAKPKLPINTLTPTVHLWEKELKYGRWLAIAPGASFPTKQAPLELFIKILETLASQTHSSGQFGLLFVGSAADRNAAVQILEKINWSGPILNLSGQLSLAESALAISKCQALLGNDAGLAHVAEAVHVPVSMLFGPTVEGFGFPPFLKKSRAFSASLGCRPCSKHGRVKCRFGDKLCFSMIPASDVAEHLAKNLGEGAK